MAKTETKRLESVGWQFWMVWFVLFYPPVTYLAWQTAYNDMKTTILPWILGFLGAALGAGLVSWAVNTVLQRRVEKARKEQRKKAKKRK